MDEKNFHLLKILLGLLVVVMSGTLLFLYLYTFKEKVSQKINSYFAVKMNLILDSDKQVSMCKETTKSRLKI